MAAAPPSGRRDSTGGPGGRPARAGPRPAGPAPRRPNRSASTSECDSVTPAASASRRPASTRPASTTQGRPRSRAAAGHAGHDLAPQATASSKLPSPVMTRSQASSASSSPVSRRTSPMPDSRRPPQARSRRARARRRRPAPGRAARPGRAAGQVTLEHAGEPLQRRVEQRDVLAGGALLRAEDRRGSVQAGQRTVHIGRCHQPHRRAAGALRRARHIAAAPLRRRAARTRPRPPGPRRARPASRPRRRWWPSRRGRPRSPVPRSRPRPRSARPARTRS